MKRILLFLVAAAMILPCNAQNKAFEKALGDKFAFAGLETAKLIPSFATEISELSVNPRSESKPMKDEVFFFTNSDIAKVPAAKVQAYLQEVYKAVKAASDDGHVYKSKGTGSQRGEEILSAPTTDKPAATIIYLYKHDGKWFEISAGHKAYFRKFAKQYPDNKFIGVGLTVKELLGSVE